ncbi:uncharacterized protein LOC113769330 [Coffea eugenioides]|uniref:uncharacterized protein LOC113769330 n=1 Tax=Coffea eugenioides TaxID=49369 RepID=UPI000F6057B9|nr:uncharacterized protein LOC113769330 [Coffea eugenioides]
MAAWGPSEKPPDGGPQLSYASVVLEASNGREPAALGEVSSFRGEPTLRLSRQEIEQLSAPFKNALVGRFSYTRPAMDVIRKFLTSLGLKGDCAAGLLDSRHVLIRPALEEDYVYLFARRIWYVCSSPMAISKWSMDFKANQELAVAPVWVAFPDLPLPFFQKNQLMRLAATLGRPLRVDAATCDLRRPSVARVLVEINITAPPVKRVRIGDEEFGFWQLVEMENLPEYCSYCTIFGHATEQCFRKHPALRPAQRPPQARLLVQPQQNPALQSPWARGALALHHRRMESVVLTGKMEVRPVGCWGALT